jgi:hypothetical protein
MARRTIKPYKVVRDEAVDGRWWVLEPDGEGGYVKSDYFTAYDEAMNAAVKYRSSQHD